MRATSFPSELLWVCEGRSRPHNSANPKASLLDGGGYQFRLAKKSAWPTEEEFQKMPMEFASKTNFIEYCDQLIHIPQKCCATHGDLKHPGCDVPYKPCGREGSIAFDAVDVNEGTHPVGSTWRRNPIYLLAKGAPAAAAARRAARTKAPRPPTTSSHPPAATARAKAARTRSTGVTIG